MPTVITTPGAADANSYVSVAEADTYHGEHLYATDWTAADTTTKQTAVIMATRILDEMYTWAQWPSANTQGLLWPRRGVMDFLQLGTIPSTQIPDKLKDATAELARQLIASNRPADSSVEQAGLKSLGVGSISLVFKDSVPSRPIPDAVRRMIPLWWGRLKEWGSWRPVGRS